MTKDRLRELVAQLRDDIEEYGEEMFRDGQHFVDSEYVTTVDSCRLEKQIKESLDELWDGLKL